MSHKFIADAVDLVFEGAVLRHFVFDYVDGGENRRMVASEYFCRILKGNIGYAANHIDRNMPGQGDFVVGMFAMLAHQRTMQEERRNDDGFVSLCRLVLLLSLGLLMVGARFVPAGWDEKSIYVAAWFVCMYGASALPHKALAAGVAPQDPTE